MEVKAGVRDTERVFLLLNRDVPLPEVTNNNLMYVNIFMGLPEFSLQYGGVPRGSIVIDIQLNSNKSYNNYTLQSIY